jgi:hypothetical protein
VTNTKVGESGKGKGKSSGRKGREEGSKFYSGVTVIDIPLSKTLVQHRRTPAQYSASVVAPAPVDTLKAKQFLI